MWLTLTQSSSNNNAQYQDDHYSGRLLETVPNVGR